MVLIDWLKFDFPKRILAYKWHLKLLPLLYTVSSVVYLRKFEKTLIRKHIVKFSQTFKLDPQNNDKLLAFGFCCLRLWSYVISEKFFDKIIDFHLIRPSDYHYRAICIFKGNHPPCVASIPLTRKAERLIKTSVEFEPGNGCYSFVLVAIKHHCIVRNGMKITDPIFNILIANAKSKHLDILEIKQMIKIQI